MNEPRKEARPPILRGSPTTAGGLAVVITIALFLLLPISQIIQQKVQPRTIIVPPTVLPPPREAPPPPPPPDEKPPEDKIDDLEEVAELPSLEMLEIASIGTMGSGVGLQFQIDFDLPGLDDIEFEIRDLDDPPVAINRVLPEIPPHAQPRRETVVNIHFVVDAQGRVRRPSVEGTHSPSLVEAVIRAINQWSFEPGKIGGRPVRTRVVLPMTIAGRG